MDLAVQMIQLAGPTSASPAARKHDQRPFGLPEMRWGADGSSVPPRRGSDFNDGLWCAKYNATTALHGSEVADEFGFNRGQDEWALHSQLAAVEATGACLDDDIFRLKSAGEKISVRRG